MRCGLHGHLEKMAHGLFDAASLFDFQRLPEVFSGHQRDERHPFPAMYPKTNWPQAWSSTAVFTVIQCMLGIYPYAPLHALFVDPHLPTWLPEMTLSNLHVGQGVVAIRFYRESDGASNYEVLEKRGHLHVVQQPSPWSLTRVPWNAWWTRSAVSCRANDIWAWLEMGVNFVPARRKHEQCHRSERVGHR